MEIVWNRMSGADWQAALPPGACALQQSWRFGATVAGLGRQVHRAQIRVDGQRVLAQLICRRVLGGVRVAYLPRGPIAASGLGAAQGREVMREIRRGLPFGKALLFCVPEQDGAGLMPLITPLSMAELPLSPDLPAMRRRMHGKWRNRLVRGENSGVTVRRTRPEFADLDWLIARDLAQQRSRRYRSLPPSFLRAWLAVDRVGAQLFTAYFSGEVVAAMLFLDHAPGATYQVGWTSDTGRAVSAHHLLLWQAMRHYGERGFARLDLGTLDTEATQGLARFKLGAGAQARRLGASGLCLPGLPWPGRRPAQKPMTAL